jgi:hypothetical protein
MEQYEVLSPVPPRLVDASGAPEINALSSAPPRIGFVWHYGYRGDEMFAEIRERFAAAHPDTVFVDHEVFGNIHGASENEAVQGIPAKLHEHGVTAVVAGVGG